MPRLYHTLSAASISLLSGLLHAAEPLSLPAQTILGGGVIELDRRFGGGELGWQRDTRLFDLPVTLAAGIAYHYQGEQRRGFVNEQGLKGRLMRDEFNAVDSQEAYLISTWQLAPRWELVAGLRHTRVEFDFDDDFLADGQDDSGHTRSQRTNPDGPRPVSQPGPG